MMRFTPAPAAPILTEVEFQSVKTALISGNPGCIMAADMVFIGAMRKIMAACDNDVTRMVASFSVARIREISAALADSFFTFVKPSPEDTGATWELVKVESNNEIAPVNYAIMRTESNRKSHSWVLAPMNAQMLLFLNALPDKREADPDIVAKMQQAQAAGLTSHPDLPKVFSQIRAAFASGNIKIDIAVVRANYARGLEDVIKSLEGVTLDGMETLFCEVVAKNALNDAELLAAFQPQSANVSASTAYRAA